MKQKKAKIFSRVLSMLLVLSLFMQGIAPISVQASETENTLVVEKTGEEAPEEKTSEDVSEEEISKEETSEGVSEEEILKEETSEDVSEDETSEDEQENVDIEEFNDYSMMVLGVQEDATVYMDETSSISEKTIVVKTATDLPTEIQVGTTVELANDIQLTEGQQIATMAGILDGKGHTITLADKPLIGSITGIVQNLGLTAEKEMKKPSELGFLDSFGSMAVTIKGGSILNCYSVVPIKDNMDDTGGLVGTSEGGVIRNSFYGGNITGYMYGGLIGKSINKEQPSVITECYFTGDKGPISQGLEYNKEEGRFAGKTVEEMKTAGFAELLNKNILDTGYRWADVEGGFPQLIVSSTPDPDPNPEPQPEGTDFSKLAAKVEEVKAMNKDDFTPETWAVVEEALTAANEVLLNVESSQKTVDAALKTLTDAVNGLKKPIPTQAVKLPAADQVIMIHSFEELKAIGTGEGKYYQLANDITVKYGAYESPKSFSGVLDGNGHVVNFDNSFYGLFENINETGIVQNVQFAGTLNGNSAPAGNVVYGAIINCISTVTGTDAVGLVKRISNGVISNCVAHGKAGQGALLYKYGGDNFDRPDGAKYEGKIYNTYWIKGSKDPVIEPDALLDGASGKSEREIKSKDIVKALNAKKGDNGIAWGQNGKTGFPYFGEDQDYDPNQIDLPDSKYVVKFGDTPETATVITDKRLDVFRNDLASTGNSVIGQFFIEGVDSKDISWSVYNVVNHAIDINKQTGLDDNGKLHIFADGEGIVKAKVKGEDAVWIKVFVNTKQMEDFKLFIDNQDVTNGSYTVQGSEWKDIKVKAQYQGETEYKNVFSGMFEFDYGKSGKVHNSGTGTFHFNEPGDAEVTVSVPETKLKKKIKLTSEYVPISSVEPDLSETNILHARASMLDGRVFDVIETNGVIILPENASNKKGFDVRSSNEDVAKFTPSLPIGYIPFKAGTTTLTAYITDTNPLTNESRVVTGERTVEFKYRNPLTKVTVNTKDITVKEGEKANLDMVFEGEKSKDGWSVTEPELIWSFSGDGAVEIGRDPLHVQHRNDGGKVYPEGEAGYWMASTDYFVEALGAGTVVATGTPVDTTNNVEPVTINITVTPGEAAHIDVPALVKEGKETALSTIRKKHATEGYQYNDEWDVYAILRDGETLTQEELDGYYSSVVEEVKTWKPSQKPTDIERVMLALAVMGKDPFNVGGVDLVTMLCNSNQLSFGSNELTYALIALDAANVEVPEGAKWTRDAMLKELLTFQNEDGGIALFPNGGSGMDTTAMTIQSLAPYKDRPEIAAAIDKGLAYLAKNLDSKMDAGNSEATAQVLLALTTLGKDPLKEEGFFNSRNNLITGLMRYHVKGEGFRHVMSLDKITDMSSVQAYHALDSYDHFVKNEATYWDANNRFYKPDTDPSEAVNKVIEAIDKLPENITLEDAPAVEAARKSYNALSGAQKKLITNLEKLTAAEAKIAELKKPEMDAAAAKKVENQIKNLKTDLSLADRATVEAARSAYEKLTPDQKKMVTNLDKLIAAEEKIKELVQNGKKGTVTFSVERFTIGQGYFVEPVIVEFTEGEAVVDIIQRVLGDKAMLRNKNNYLEAIKTADKGADSVNVPEYITSISKGAVTTESTKEYYNAVGKNSFDPGVLGEFTYNMQAGWMYHVNGVEEMLGVGERQVKDKDVIRVQYTLYGLGEDLTGYVQDAKEPTIVIENKDEITKLMAEVNAMADVIKNYPAVKEAYANAVKSVEKVITPKEELDKAFNDLKAAIEEAVKDNNENAEKRAAEVEKVINELSENLTLEDKGAVEAARKAYDGLTEEQKKLVTNVDKLKKAEEQIKKLENEKLEADKKTAETVEKQIEELPEKIVLENKDAIEAARKAYDGLTEEQKKLVVNTEKLVKAEKALKELEEDKAAVEAVEKQINELPEKVSLEDKAAVEAARKAYDALTTDQQKMITNIDKLKKAEKEIADIEKEHPQKAESLKDAASKVELKGEGLTSDMQLVVKNLGKDDEDVKQMQKKIPKTEGMIRIYDVKLVRNGEEIDLPEKSILTLPVAKDFEGKQLKILFCSDSQVEVLESVVKNGAVQLPVEKLGSFGIVVNVKDIPKTPGKNPANNSESNQGSGAGVITGSTGTVRTADESPIGMLLIISMLSLVVVAVSSKRRNRVY